MSGWTILTIRGKVATDYTLTRKDWDHDRSFASQDIAASFAEDSRVGRVTTYRDTVYALLNCSRYDFEFAESLFEDYEKLLDDAVVLGWNDTTDTGVARYYDRPDLAKWMHEYEEDRNGEKGERACAVMHAQHGIYAQNPFHNEVGRRKDRDIENGNVISEVLDDGN